MATGSRSRSSTRAIWILAVAAVAVAFAAADTYVVVVAIPDMMAGIGKSIDKMQQAAPIVSSFLLGYVSMLPLIGRLADVHGRIPVLLGGLAIFAFGSLVTTLSYDMASLVVGRFLQGIGGGALVPATIALVADLFTADKRSMPLGIVSGVQEVGSLIGPMIGAAILAWQGWRAIFAVNVIVAVVLCLALTYLTRHVKEHAEETTPAAHTSTHPDAEHASTGDAPVGPWRILKPAIVIVLAALTVVDMCLVMIQPSWLVRSLTWGQLLIPTAGPAAGWGRWLAPLGLIVIGLAVLTIALASWWRSPFDVRRFISNARKVDLLGAVILAFALAGIVLAFATSDPAQHVLNTTGYWYLIWTAVMLVALWIHFVTTDEPLIPRGALHQRPAWGGVLVSLGIGASLMAALVDVPLFARLTVYPDSQVGAAFVLMRFLIAIPIGAIAGGWASRKGRDGAVTAVAMLLVTIGFVFMARWGTDALHHWTATIPLVIAGLGFGMALAPVNNAVLAATDRSVHGLASSLVVVARMVGMLVGVSILTDIGLRRYYEATASMPTVEQACPQGGLCDNYTNLLLGAGVSQEHVVFAGAAIIAACSGVVAAFALHRHSHNPHRDAELSLG